MNMESNLATNTTLPDSDTTGAEDQQPLEKLIAFAPPAQVPVQLEHWLRKRQVALETYESAALDMEALRTSGAKYALVDLEAQGAADLGFLGQIREELPLVKIIVMTASSDARYLESLNEAGAHAVIVKRPYVADLALAIQAAGEGRSYVTGSSAQKDGAAIQITARERQVLELMANGYSNQAIGEKLTISVKTVEAHRARLFKKLGASNVADAVLLAIRVGLVMP